MRKNPYKVKIIDDDLQQNGYEKVSEMAQNFNPKVIGVTATTSTIKSAVKYVDFIKDALPNSLTVLGGPHATFMPTKTLKENESLDLVVKGEGEETLVEITNKLFE